jgi:hypothetical protein
MLSGVSVMGQAKKCLEFQDLLRAHGVSAQFAGSPNTGGRHSQQQAPADIPSQIAKLAELHAQGILSDHEFAAKKSDLLSRM